MQPQSKTLDILSIALEATAVILTAAILFTGAYFYYLVEIGEFLR